MRIFQLNISILLIILLIPTVNIFAQSNILSRRNPDGWFSLLIPKVMGKVERHADVDGGFYINNELDISYYYWSFDGTPNFLRDVRGEYSKAPMLACSKKSRQTKTLRTKIDGKIAVIQSCSETDERTGFHYIYYVTFPKMKVFNGESYENGMFNLTIEYKDKRYSTLAERIIRSINFKK